MSDPDVTAAPGAPTGQKKVSGLLMVSVLLTLMGLFMVPLLPTVAGLITAVKGRAKAIADPFIIGPRFGMFCIIAAVLALPVNGWQVTKIWDNLKYREASSVAIQTVFTGLQARDYAAAWDGIDGEFHRDHTVEEFTAAMQAAFPGTEPIALSEETVKPRVNKLSPEDEAAFTAFFKGEADTLDHTYEVVANEAGGRTNLDLRVVARRLGWAKYEVRVLSVRAWLAEDSGTPDPAKAPEDANPEKTDPGETPGAKSAEGAPEDEPK